MSEAARDRILDACARVIARNGLRRFRMQDVAREAGVSIGLLPYHFGDRDGLLQAALDRVNAGAADRARAEAGDEGPRERLRALLLSEFGDDPGVREGSTAWNELRAAAVFEPATAAALARSTAAWQGEVERLVREADPEPCGGDPAASARAAALGLTALVEGLSGRWLTGQIGVAQARAAIDAALASTGLGPAEDRDGSA